MPKDDRIINALLESFAYEKALRRKSDNLRNEAYGIVNHRTKDLSACADSPVTDERRYSDMGIKAVETFINGYMSAVVPQNARWFGASIVPRIYRMGQSPIEDLVYTSYVEKCMMEEFSKSNFYAQNKLASMDSFIGGYSCMMVQEDPVKKRTNFDTLVPWRCWFDCDRFGNWDTFFYEYHLNGYEMLERFPNMNDELKKSCRELRTNGSYTMLMCIFDRQKLLDLDGEEMSLVFSKGMKFGVVHICLSTNEIVDEGGYNDFPVVIHLWEQVSDSHYGIGLVMKYISEFRKLKKVGHEWGIAFEKQNHGGYNVPESIKETFSDDPYARNYYVTPDQLASRIEPPPDMKVFNEVLMSQVQTVREICYNDFMTFLTQHEQVYTATQVNAIKSESLQQVAPLSDNINTQKLLPVLKLTYVNMLNGGRITLPETGVMAEVDEHGEQTNVVTFQFVAAMSEQLNLYSQLNAANSIAEQANIWVQMTQDPTLIQKNFKINNILKVSARASGADADFIMTDEETSVEEEKLQKQAQQAQQMEMMQQASEIDRNEAGASNLNNSMGANGGFN